MASSQKFIGRNRPPRVQIEYDVETGGAEKKIELPFVMGVMADLSGNAGEGKPGIDDRHFTEIDVDNFEDYLYSTKPKVRMRVKNTLSDTEGEELPVEVSFESMDDFSPAAVAAKVEPLAKLLEARTQLSNLVTWMDGRAGAEELVAAMINDPALLGTLSASAKPAEEPPPEEKSDEGSK